jgi:protein-S-isoprenylcysteine O-methyltransferase Ste14
MWTVESPVGREILWAMSGLGWLIALSTTFLISHFDLFGLRQVWLPLIGRAYTPVNFRTPLPYRLIRHPLYFGFLLAFWATPVMTAAHLLFAVGTTAYIVIAIQLEERDLIAQHGDSYQRYRQSVPMLIPAIKPRTIGAVSGNERLRAPRS